MQYVNLPPPQHRRHACHATRRAAVVSLIRAYATPAANRYHVKATVDVPDVCYAVQPKGKRAQQRRKSIKEERGKEPAFAAARHAQPTFFVLHLPRRTMFCPRATHAAASRRAACREAARHGNYVQR